MNTNKVECQTWNTNQIRNLQMPQTPALAAPKSQVLRCCPHSLLSGCSGGIWCEATSMGRFCSIRSGKALPLRPPCSSLCPSSSFMLLSSGGRQAGRGSEGAAGTPALHHRLSARDCSHPWKKGALLDTFSTPSVIVLRHGPASLNP